MWNSNLQAGFEHSPGTRRRHLRDSEPRSTVRPFRQAFCAPRGRRTMLERPAAKLGIALSFVVRVRRGDLARTEVRAHPTLATERIATGRVPSRVLRDEDERRTSDGSVLRAGWDGGGRCAPCVSRSSFHNIGRCRLQHDHACKPNLCKKAVSVPRANGVHTHRTPSRRSSGQTSSLGLGLVSEPL